jgi:NAD(P)-dependent dehydrogenase (short-subunit alcohol dehydrogenase family)
LAADLATDDGIAAVAAVCAAEPLTMLVNNAGVAPFEEVYDDYRFTEHLAGARHFSLMPLSRLATALFGDPAWLQALTVPQAWIEFEIDDIESAMVELEGRGYDLLVRAREEPWGQVLTRLLAPGGPMVGIV